MQRGNTCRGVSANNVQGEDDPTDGMRGNGDND